VTREELFAAALECANAAKEQALRRPDSSEAYSRAGQLLLQLAEHQYGMELLRPRPAPDRDTLAV
jgi:hypothetical protein